ncbi:membrane dipeptidase, partial [Azohydromonas lata]
MNELHARSIVIDGLIISKWDRSVFEDMKKGGLTAANCTVSVWDDFKGTVHNIAQMKAMIRDNADLLSLVRTTADIEQAKRDG